MTDPKNELMTRPSDYADMLDDDRKFKRYVIDNIVESNGTRRDITDRLVELEAAIKSMTTSVADYEQTKQQLSGAKTLLLGFFFVGSCMWAVVQALLWLVAKLKGGQ